MGQDDLESASQVQLSGSCSQDSESQILGRNFQVPGTYFQVPGCQGPGFQCPGSQVLRVPGLGSQGSGSQGSEISHMLVITLEPYIKLKFSEDTNRSSRPEVFYKKDVLRNFAKFIGKHLCQGLFYNKVAGLRLVTGNVSFQLSINFAKNISELSLWLSLSRCSLTYTNIIILRHFFIWYYILLLHLGLLISYLCDMFFFIIMTYHIILLKQTHLFLLHIFQSAFTCNRDESHPRLG